MCERPGAPKKTHVPDDIEFHTKPQLAVQMIDRALGNGVCVSAWTFDELYGRDGKFLDALEQRRQVFVGEIPANFHGWVQKPEILEEGPKNRRGGRLKQYPRLAAGHHSSEVRNLVKHSPVFRKQSWQPYRIKDTDKGPVVWEVKWAVFWRKDEDGLPTRRHCLPPRVAGVSRKNATNSNTTSRPAVPTGRPDSNSCAPWESTSARSNPASPTPDPHDTHRFNHTTYNKMPRQSGAVQLLSGELAWTGFWIFGRSVLVRSLPDARMFAQSLETVLG
ncbi:MAG: transposase [Planctomycetes bacterium]|nr:transposase [Planctomycetota bacterium]